MDRNAALYFRDELRRARAIALANAEDFKAVVIVLERLGGYLGARRAGFGAYREVLGRLANASPLAMDVPQHCPGHHIPFDTLFTLVLEGRNSAVHEGALARHLTLHTVELSLILEDALMPELGETTELTVADFMLRGPVTASAWQPLSFVRQAMLTSSFSYLPVRLSPDDDWHLVSDCAIAAYLRSSAGRKELSERLKQTLAEAVQSGGIGLTKARTAGLGTRISDVLQPNDGRPILVLDNPSELLGIVAPFDLL